MTDPLALEPILGPTERSRPGFNDDLPHDERFVLFEEHVAAGLSLTVYKVSLALLGWRMLGVKTWIDPTFGSVRRLIAQRRG